MTGAERRLIKQSGREYTVRNATQGSSTRDVNAYSDDGSVNAVLRERRRPIASSDSAGEEIDGAFELRAIVPSGVSIYEPGGSNQQPTRFEHPDGLTYELQARHYEDGGVDVFLVDRV